MVRGIARCLWDGDEASFADNIAEERRTFVSIGIKHDRRGSGGPQNVLRPGLASDAGEVLAASEAPLTDTMFAEGKASVADKMFRSVGWPVLPKECWTKWWPRWPRE